MSDVNVMVMLLQAMIEDDALIALTAHHWCWGADNSGDVRRPENIKFIWEEAKVSPDRCMKHFADARVVHSPEANLCVLKQPCSYLVRPAGNTRHQHCSSHANLRLTLLQDMLVAYSSSHARFHSTRQQNMICTLKQPYVPLSGPPAKGLLVCSFLPDLPAASSHGPPTR